MAKPKQPNGHLATGKTSTYFPSSSSSSPNIDPITLEKTRSRSRSRRRRPSADSDPLSPLDEALASPGQETAYERLARQGSATSSSHSSRRATAAAPDDNDDNDNDHPHHNPLSRAHTGTTSIASRPPDHEVVFGAPDGPSDPRTWSLRRRAWVIFCVSFSTWVVVLYSTSYTAGMPGVMAEFGVSDEAVATLGVTTYLLGLAVGSLIVAPMSELYGRRPVYISCLACFCLMVIPTAMATILAEILVVRFFG